MAKPEPLWMIALHQIGIGSLQAVGSLFVYGIVVWLIYSGTTLGEHLQKALQFKSMTHVTSKDW